MAPSCPALLRLRESHEEAIYAIAFNQVDASLAAVFATVGANRVTVYRLEEEDETAAEDIKPPGAAPGADAKASSKRFHARSRSARSLRTLQAYRDEDDDESFYCVAWGLEICAQPSGIVPTAAPSAQEESGMAGCLLAVAGAQRHVKLLDCCTGSVRAVLQGHGGAINELRFHPRERALLLSASADESIRLWHVGTRACLATFLGDEGHRDAVVSIDFKHDGSAFASGSIDGTVKVWSLASDKLQARVAEAHSEHVATSAAAAAAAAESMAAGQAHDRAEAMPPAEASEARGARMAGDDVLDGNAASGGAALPAVASLLPPRHCLVCQFPVATYERVHYDVGAQLSYWVDCVRFVGRLLLTRGSDGRTLLWDPADAVPVARATGEEETATAASRREGEARPRLVPSASLAFRIGGTAGIWYLRFALDPFLRRLALGNTRGEVCVWNLEKAQLTPIVRELDRELDREPSAVAAEEKGPATSCTAATRNDAPKPNPLAMAVAKAKAKAEAKAKAAVETAASSSAAATASGPAAQPKKEKRDDGTEMNDSRGSAMLSAAAQESAAALGASVLFGQSTAAPGPGKVGSSAGGPSAPSARGAQGIGGTNGTRVVPPFAALRISLEECDAKRAKKGGSKKSAVLAAEDLLTVRSTAVSHDGKYVVGGCDEGSIVLWELAA